MMTLYNLLTADDAPAPRAALALLSEALEHRDLAPAHRVIATMDSRSPDEGLALLDAYVAITDQRLRQALLDVMIALGGNDPYRRNRRLTAPKTNDPAP